MKKISCFLSLIVITMTVNYLTAQSVSCPDGFYRVDTTTEISEYSSQYIPFGSQPYYEGFTYYCNMCWYVFDRMEIEDVGITPGSLIDSLGFRLISDTFALSNVRIYLKEVSFHSIMDYNDTVPIDSMQLVFSSQLITFSRGWNNFRLDSIFTYTGSGHLMMAVCRDSPVTMPISGSFSTFSGKSIVRRKTSPNSGDWETWMYNSRPSVSFGLCAATSSCTRPVISYNSTDNTISAHVSSSASSYQFFLAEQALEIDIYSDSIQIVSSTVDSMLFTNLSPNTSYIIYARGICGSDTSAWAHQSAITCCGVKQLPYHCQVYSQMLDSCYILYNAIKNDYGLFAEDPNSKAIVVLPELDGYVDKLRLHFQTISHLFPTPIAPLEIGLMNNPYDSSTFVPLESDYRSNYSFLSNAVLMLDSGDNRRIAIRGEGYLFSYLIVDTLFGCFSPVDLSHTTDSLSVPILSWRNRALHATSYQIEYHPASNESDVHYLVSDTTFIRLDSIPLDDYYLVRVRPLCDEYGEWSETYVINPICETNISLPYIYNYSGYSTRPSWSSTYLAPLCWSYIEDAARDRFYWISPPIDTANFRMDQLKISYDIMFFMAAGKKIEIGIMDADTASFIALDSIISTANQFLNSDLRTCYSNLRYGDRVAFRTPIGAIEHFNGVSIEHFICPPVRDLSLIESYPHDLVIGWTEQGTADHWLVDYASTGSNSHGSIIATNNPFTITGLNMWEYYNITVCALNYGDTSTATSATFRTILDSNHIRTMVQIGDPSNSSYNGCCSFVNRYDKHSWTQSVYPMSQYYTEGIIDTVWFYCTHTMNRIQDTSLSFFMGHVDETTSPPDYWIPMDSLFLVFHVSDFRAGCSNCWVPIPLETPFYYNGVNDLALVFSRSSYFGGTNLDHYSTHGDGDYSKSCSGNEPIYSMFPGLNGNSYSLYLADVRFSMITESCLSVAGLSISHQNLDSVWLTWRERGHSQQWQIIFYNDDSSHVDSLLLSSQSDNQNPTIVISGLWSNNNYSFIVRPICDDDGSVGFSSPVSTFVTTCPAPDNLRFGNITDASVDLSWHENSNASLWEVSYASVDDARTHRGSLVTSSDSITIGGLFSWTQYSFSVRAICGDGDSSIFSIPATVTTLRGHFDYDQAQIGTGAAINYSTPINVFYKHSWNQMIYQSEAIGMNGFIDTIWWRAATVGANPPDTGVRVYLGHTQMQSHTNTNAWLPMNELQLVFSSSQALPADTGWFPIPLTSVFYYNGVDNLVVCVSSHSSTFTNAWKFYIDSVSNSVLRRISDNEYSTGEHPGTINGVFFDCLPVMRLSMTGRYPDCHRPWDPQITDISYNSAKLQWRSTADDTAYNVQYSCVGDTSVTLYVSDTVVVLNNLLDSSHYDVSVVSVCSQEHFSEPLELSFTTQVAPPRHTAIGLSSDSTLGLVRVGTLDKGYPNSGVFFEGTMLSFNAIPVDEYSFFQHWDDGDTSNPRTITLNCDTTLTAYFSSVPLYYVIGLSNDSSLGTVSIRLLNGLAYEENRYSEGSLVELCAVPQNEVSFFSQWDDGDTTNPRIITLLSDTTLIAYFYEDYDGIFSDFNKTAPELNIHPNPAERMVSLCLSTDRIVSLLCYDINGHLVFSKKVESECCDIDVSSWSKGQYILRLTTSTTITLMGKLIVK